MTITRKTLALFRDIVKGTRTVSPEDLKPLFNEKIGRWRPAALSPLEKARLKKLATIFQYPIPNVTDEPSCAPIRLVSGPRESLREKAVEAKRHFVQERMERMPQLIESWRAERKAQHEKTKPKYPF